MFQHLAIKNYILIQDIQVDLSRGFNVFTGETGAGKSMLVDAMNFISGQRSSAAIVGKNDSLARVEAVLELPSNHPIYDKLSDLGLNEDEELSIILTREMTKEGRNTFRINNRLVSLSTARECLEGVIDIHSQHETQYLLNSKNHLNLLDEFSDNDTLRTLLSSSYQDYLEAKKRLDDFKTSDLNPNEIKRIRKELEELQVFNVSQEDYEVLNKQIEVMSNFEDYQDTYSSLIEMFSNDVSGLAVWHSGIGLFDHLGDGTLLSQFKDAYYSLEDLQDTIIKRRSELNFDVFEFDRLQERLFQYQQLLKKHETIEDVLDYVQKLEETLHQADSFDDICIDFENEMQRSFDKAYEIAQDLHNKRVDAARILEGSIGNHLNDLLLENAKFKVVINEQELTLNGIDNVNFHVAMNKGSDFAPLDKVASGGELSRLMLGLKVIFSQLQGINTVVFDEIDTGVSGRVGIQIGSKMKELAKSTQVLTITHLSSVAACATTHFSITKADDVDQTVTSIQAVSGERRIQELALIMSGSMSENSMAAAEELLREGQAI